MPRIALGVPVAPGREHRLAGLLAQQAAPERGRRAAPVATFTAAGTVLHIVDIDTTGPVAAQAKPAVSAEDADVPAGTADLPLSPETDSLLHECCAVPRGRSAREFLDGTVLIRRAHYARPLAGPRPPHRRALLYPVRPGRAGDLGRLLAAGIAPGTTRRLSTALVSSTVFARGGTVVRFWEATADPDEEIDNLLRVVPYSGLGAALNDLLEFDQDLTTESGFRAFFTGCAMSLVPGPDGSAPALRPPHSTTTPEEET